jgi:UDP-N-acetylmuramate dehydrogenase
MSLVDIVKKLNLKEECKFQKNLANLTRFGVGGPAEVFYSPYDQEELSYFLKSIPPNIAITVIGNGSNLLIKDKGVKDVVIKLGKNFASINLSENHIYAGAATLNRVFAKTCMMNNVANFEFIEWIPGSVGGGISMNAGSYGGEFSDSLVSIKAIDRFGDVKILTKDQIQFDYRKTSIPSDYIILEAKFARIHQRSDLIKEKMAIYFEQKKSTQPIFCKTAGSTFINPKSGEKKSWQYVQEVGGANMRIGDAIWSQKHLNFAVNLNSASAKNIEDLIVITKQEIYKKFSVMLELEVKILGTD